MQPPIYLDNNATTKPLPVVVDAVIEALKADDANPSSLHAFGQKARYRLVEARQKIASLLAVQPREIIFTSGGTEGINLLLKGFLQGKHRPHVITSNVEHSCVMKTLAGMEQEGISCTYLEAGKWGAVTVDAVANAIRPETKLIALIGVNNETGVKTDIEAIASLAATAGIPFVVDGVSWLGKEPLQIYPGITAMAFSGHKFHAPKGVGFVFLRATAKLTPQLTGGDQEFGRRAGTENLPGIAGMTKALEYVLGDLSEACQRMQKLRYRLETELMHRLNDVTVNGNGPRVANTTNLAFSGVEGEVLLAALDLEGIAVSHGSACASGALEPSHVLINMGCTKSVASSSIRFSLSRLTTAEEIDRCIESVVKIITRMRK